MRPIREGLHVGNQNGLKRTDDLSKGASQLLIPLFCPNIAPGVSRHASIVGPLLHPGSTARQQCSQNVDHVTAAGFRHHPGNPEGTETFLSGLPDHPLNVP